MPEPRLDEWNEFALQTLSSRSSGTNEGDFFTFSPFIDKGFLGQKWHQDLGFSTKFARRNPSSKASP